MNMGSIVSHLLHFSENVFVCITCSSLVTCLVFTIAMTLLLGIGLGYNYCFIDFKSKHRYVPARYEYKYGPTPLWRAGTDDEYYDKETNESNLIKVDSETNTTSRNDNANGSTILQPDTLYANDSEIYNTSESVTEIRQGNELKYTEDRHKGIEHYNVSDVLKNSKILIPMSDLDLISLLSKWRAENRNYSLQVVVT